MESRKQHSGDEDTSQTNIFNFLPAEIMVYILHFIDLKQLGELCAISQYLNTIASDNSLWAFHNRSLGIPKKPWISEKETCRQFVELLKLNMGQFRLSPDDSRSLLRQFNDWCHQFHTILDLNGNNYQARIKNGDIKTIDVQNQLVARKTHDDKAIQIGIISTFKPSDANTLDPSHTNNFHSNDATTLNAIDATIFTGDTNIFKSSADENDLPPGDIVFKPSHAAKPNSSDANNEETEISTTQNGSMLVKHLLSASGNRFTTYDASAQYHLHVSGHIDFTRASLLKQYFTPDQALHYHFSRIGELSLTTCLVLCTHEPKFIDDLAFFIKQIENPPLIFVVTFDKEKYEAILEKIANVNETKISIAQVAYLPNEESINNFWLSMETTLDKLRNLTSLVTNSNEYDLTASQACIMM